MDFIFSCTGTQHPSSQVIQAEHTGALPRNPSYAWINKAFVGLGSCDNVQTERKIFEYANWPRLQIKRTGPSSWSVQLVRPAGPSSWSIQLVCPAALSSKVHVLQSAHVVKCTCCKVQKAIHILHFQFYPLHLMHCI